MVSGWCVPGPLPTIELRLQTSGGAAQRSPAALKVVHGDRSDRINHDEPLLSEGEVNPPAELSDDARAVWVRLAPGPDRCRRPHCLGIHAFVIVGEALARYRQVSRLVIGSTLLRQEPIRFVKNPRMVVQLEAKTTFAQYVTSSDTLIQPHGAQDRRVRRHLTSWRRAPFFSGRSGSSGGAGLVNLRPSVSRRQRFPSASVKCMTSTFAFDEPGESSWTPSLAGCFAKTLAPSAGGKVGISTWVPRGDDTTTSNTGILLALTAKPTSNPRLPSPDSASSNRSSDQAATCDAWRRRFWSRAAWS